MKIVLGLGNPGKKYRNNRHNIGFMVVDKLAEDSRATFKTSLLTPAALAKVKGAAGGLVLAKPLTFMNNSGTAAARIAARYGACLDDILVVYDDVDLDLGEIRVRRSGSAGGHRGMASLIENFNSDNINRLRVGICRPSEGKEVADYVLSDFSKAETGAVRDIIEASAGACLDWALEGIDTVMSRYNIRKINKAKKDEGY
jgi:peptidyl-tRNA hydrolase, PTH1 family